MSGPRWRWTVARWLDKLPGTCWADLVSWALRYDGYRLPCKQGQFCRPDAQRMGTCYCGKVRHEHPSRAA